MPVDITPQKTGVHNGTFDVIHGWNTSVHHVSFDTTSVSSWGTPSLYINYRFSFVSNLVSGFFAEYNGGWYEALFSSKSIVSIGIPVAAGGTFSFKISPSENILGGGYSTYTPFLSTRFGVFNKETKLFSQLGSTYSPQRYMSSFTHNGNRGLIVNGAGVSGSGMMIDFSDNTISSIGVYSRGAEEYSGFAGLDKSDPLLCNTSKQLYSFNWATDTYQSEGVASISRSVSCINTGGSLDRIFLYNGGYYSSSNLMDAISTSDKSIQSLGSLPFVSFDGSACGDRMIK
jgi:hypothetical protein